MKNLNQVDIYDYDESANKHVWALGNGMLHREANLPAVIETFSRVDQQYEVATRLTDTVHEFYVFNILVKKTIRTDIEKKRKLLPGIWGGANLKLGDIRELKFIEFDIPKKSSYAIAEAFAVRLAELKCIGDLHELLKAMKYCFPNSPLVTSIPMLIENIEALGRG